LEEELEEDSEFNSDSDSMLDDNDDTLGIEELEREVAQLLESHGMALEVDSELDPEPLEHNELRATRENSDSTSKWYTDSYPRSRRLPLCVQADYKRREKDRARQDRDKHLLAKWPRGKGPDKVRLLIEGLYST
jgi:hypothetical protein